MRETTNDEEKSKWHPGEEGRPTEGKAHDEANAMRGKMGVRPYRKGTIEDKQREPQTFGESMEKLHQGDIGRKPTRANYEEVFKVIEELKQAAKDEPTYQKVAAQIMRVAARPVQEMLNAVDVLATGPGISKEVDKWHEERLKTFEDAEKRLRDAQKLGEKFAKDELLQHPNTPEAR